MEDAPVPDVSLTASEQVRLCVALDVCLKRVAACSACSRAGVGPAHDRARPTRAHVAVLEPRHSPTGAWISTWTHPWSSPPDSPAARASPSLSSARPARSCRSPPASCSTRCPASLAPVALALILH